MPDSPRGSWINPAVSNRGNEAVRLTASSDFGRGAPSALPPSASFVGAPRRRNAARLTCRSCLLPCCRRRVCRAHSRSRCSPRIRCTGPPDETRHDQPPQLTQRRSRACRVIGRDYSWARRWEGGKRLLQAPGTRGRSVEIRSLRRSFRCSSGCMQPCARSPGDRPLRRRRDRRERNRECVATVSHDSGFPFCFFKSGEIDRRCRAHVLTPSSSARNPGRTPLLIAFHPPP